MEIEDRVECGEHIKKALVKQSPLKKWMEVVLCLIAKKKIMALGPPNVFDSFVCNKEFELFELFGEGQVVNFEVFATAV